MSYSPSLRALLVASIAFVSVPTGSVMAQSAAGANKASAQAAAKAAQEAAQAKAAQEAAAKKNLAKTDVNKKPTPLQLMLEDAGKKNPARPAAKKP